MKKLQKVKTHFRQFNFFQATLNVCLRGISKIFNHYSKEVYSQNGEDILIKSLLNKEKGFYVDIGCHHPKSMSNTYLFYQKGWTGMNVDANPDLIKKFKRNRPNDICLCEAVSDVREELTFYEFDSAAVSTLDAVQVEEWKKQWNVVNERKVVTKTLTDLLDEHQISQPIDFLSIDVEGHDLQVLRSLDFSKYRPSLIIVEMHGFDMEQPTDNEVYNFMHTQGYKLSAYAVFNGYFSDTRAS